MAISEKDWDFMKRVAEYYEQTKLPSMDSGKSKSKKRQNGSINATASHFGLTRTKVTKILVTMGGYQTTITDAVQKLRSEGKKVKEIAGELGISVGAVSSYLPYRDEFHGSSDPSNHASAMREYRAYEKAKAERQIQRRVSGDKDMERAKMDTAWKDEWKKDVKLSYTETETRPPRMTWEDADARRLSPQEIHPELSDRITEIDQRHQEEMKEAKRLRDLKERNEHEQERMAELEKKYGFFPGALADRNMQELERISGERIPFQPGAVLHLHLELQDWWSERELEKVRKYGKLNGDHISRDVVVPCDMPLYAIHYMMQRLFGWENSHLHEFVLSFEDAKRVTSDKVEVWEQLVGIVFRSPLMDEDEEFWADDYESGSFKNWLTKKYTGPYLSQCYGEGFFSCAEDMTRLDCEEEYYVQTVETAEGERVIDCIPVKGYEPPRKSKWHSGEQRLQKLKLKECPIDASRLIFERNALALLERLPVDSVLRCADDEETCCNGEALLEEIRGEVQALVKSGEDSPIRQIRPAPVTDTIYYNYDFGDGWCVAITATRNCEEMVERGIVTQDQLDKANIKCRELYRPVTIAVDGEMLVDDVGGTGGFADFLEKIHPDLAGMSKEEKAEARIQKKEYQDWAKGLGWRRLSPWI